jgi:hypothetical protein
MMEEHTLEELGKIIKSERLEKNSDVVIAICGIEGSGKSTVAIILGKAIDDDFDIEKNVVYIPNHQEIIKKIYQLPKGSALVIDEAIMVSYKRRWYSAAQIKLNEIYTVCRKQNIATILCMPDFNDFDRYWRDHRVLYWIQVIRRSLGVIIHRSENFYGTEKWNLKYNENLIWDKLGKKNEWEISEDSWLKMVCDTRGCMGWFIWESLEGTDIWMRYNELSGQYKRDLTIPEITINQALKYKTTLILILKHLYMEKKYTLPEIGKIAHLDRHTVSNYLKEGEVNLVE